MEKLLLYPLPMHRTRTAIEEPRTGATGTAWRVVVTRLLLPVAAVAAISQCKGRVYAPPVEIVPELTAQTASLSSGFQAIDPPDASNNDDARPLAAFSNVRARMGGNGRPERDVLATLVTPNFFEICREQALVGRMFSTAETGAIVAVLGYTLWMEQFGGNKDIVGRGVRVNAQLYTVVAVAHERFVFPEGSDLWLTVIQTSEVPPPKVIRSNDR